MAENELTSVILADLRAAQAWQTQTSELLRQMSERLSRVESRIENIEKLRSDDAKSIDELESLKAQGTGIKNFIGYAVAAIPGLIALAKVFIGG